MLKKIITQCDSLINPERAVCGNGKLELEGKKESRLNDTAGDKMEK